MTTERDRLDTTLQAANEEVRQLLAAKDTLHQRINMLVENERGMERQLGYALNAARSILRL